MPASNRRTTCGAGHEVTCFSPDGNEYPCFRFSPLVVDRPLLDVHSTPYRENALCAQRPFVKICTSCEGHNYEATGSCFGRGGFIANSIRSPCWRPPDALIDHPVNGAAASEQQGVDERLKEMRRLLAIRLVDNLCSPVRDWAMQAPARSM